MTSSDRWFFNAFCKVLQPNITVLLDVGTRPGPKSLYHLYVVSSETFNDRAHLMTDGRPLISTPTSVVLAASEGSQCLEDSKQLLISLQNNCA